MSRREPTRTGEESPLLGDRAHSHANGNGHSHRSIDSPDLRAGGPDARNGESHDQAPLEISRVRALCIMLSLWGMIFLQTSNISGITTTQSKIAEDLDAFGSASWFTSSFMIAVSSVSPLTARLAQIFSARKCMLASAILFAVGGIITSQAQHLAVFLLGRVVSGVGGAGVMTISFILVLELSDDKRRGLFVGLINTGFTAGIALGAVVAGALLPLTGWRNLFLAQSPIALIAGLCLFFSIPSTLANDESEASEQTIGSKLAEIDYPGAITLTGSIFLFLFGLSGPQIIWTPIILSSFTLILFVLIESKIATNPIIPLSILKSRGALLLCVAQLGLMAARWMVLFYSPVYAIAIRGWTPASAGSVLIPTNLGFGLGGILVGWLHIKRNGSFWLAAIISILCFGMTEAVLALISTPTSSTPVYLLTVFLNGLSLGAALNYTLAHLLHLTHPSNHVISTSLLNTFRGFAGAFGSAIGGGLFVRILKSGLENGFEENGGLAGKEPLVRKLLGSPALVQSLQGVEKDVAVASYVQAVTSLLAVGAGLAVFMAVVQACTGWKGADELLEEAERGADDSEA